MKLLALRLVRAAFIAVLCMRYKIRVQSQSTGAYNQCGGNLESGC